MARKDRKFYSKYDKKKRKKENACRLLLGLIIVAFLFGFSLVGFAVFQLDLNTTNNRVENGSDASVESLLDDGPEVVARAGTAKMDHGDMKFLIFHKLEEAQGAGNHVHGLLAAHLLADEFGRVVCVSDHYEDFHLAFRHADPTALEHCPDILRRHNKELPETDVDKTITLLNYEHPKNECHLKELLASSSRVLHFSGNTYPRWPHVPPHINFFQFYQPKAILLEILPYSHDDPPPIVVHLRQPDKEAGDSRKGVDSSSLKALGELLPLDKSRQSPFLVTNNVQWFDYFQKEFGWSHPYWQIVMHSALGFQWEGRVTEKPSTNAHLYEKYRNLREKIGASKWEILQLWADWYTLLRAKKVYHTFSDFSLSAVHWMNTWSRTYDGLDPQGKPILLEENWIIDGESPRLMDRSDGELRNCHR